MQLWRGWRRSSRGNFFCRCRCSCGCRCARCCADRCKGRFATNRTRAKITVAILSGIRALDPADVRYFDCATCFVPHAHRLEAWRLFFRTIHRVIAWHVARNTDKQAKQQPTHCCARRLTKRRVVLLCVFPFFASIFVSYIDVVVDAARRPRRLFVERWRGAIDGTGWRGVLCA